MNKATAVFTGLGIGTGMMYFLDPDRGRRRRTEVRDKSLSALRTVDQAIAATSCDVSNRARGLVAEMRSIVSGERVPDEVLVARIESKIRPVISDAGAITVQAMQGNVLLTGPIPTDEVDDLIDVVRSVRGVGTVESRLDERPETAGIPARKGRAKPTHQFELLQENWSPTARLAMSVAGGALALHGARHRTAVGSTLGLFGLGLFLRGLTNMKLQRLLGLDGERGSDGRAGTSDRQRELVRAGL